MENIYEKPSQYRISTITSTGSLGVSSIDLNILYSGLSIINDDINDGIVYIEYGNKKDTTIYKGFSKKFLINRRKHAVNKRFDNQLTVIYRYTQNNIISNLNIKIFKNGNLQITGIKNINQGKIVIDNLIVLISENKKLDNHNLLINTNYKIRLINSDFKVGFEINRDNLYKILRFEYNIVCSYEPVIYPGVKLQYFWNKNNHLQDGICYCEKNCIDGKGNGITSCKKITIAIFQSGCIIITGAFNIQQIDDAYQFINNILYNNISRIEKKQIIHLPEKKEKRKIVILYKSQIKQINDF